MNIIPTVPFLNAFERISKCLLILAECPMFSRGSKRVLIPIQHRFENASVADTEYLKFQHLSVLLIASEYFGIEPIDYRRWFVKFSRWSSLVHATTAMVNATRSNLVSETGNETLRIRTWQRWDCIPKERTPLRYSLPFFFSFFFFPIPFELNGKRKFESRVYLTSKTSTWERSGATTQQPGFNVHRVLGIQKSLSPGVNVYGNEWMI